MKLILTLFLVVFSTSSPSFAHPHDIETEVVGKWVTAGVLVENDAKHVLGDLGYALKIHENKKFEILRFNNVIVAQGEYSIEDSDSKNKIVFHFNPGEKGQISYQFECDINGDRLNLTLTEGNNPTNRIQYIFDKNELKGPEPRNPNEWI